MPKGTRVEKCFTGLKRQGASDAKAAAICQSSTGQSLSTGKKRGNRKGGGYKPGRGKNK